MITPELTPTCNASPVPSNPIPEPQPLTSALTLEATEKYCSKCYAERPRLPSTQAAAPTIPPGADDQTLFERAQAALTEGHRLAGIGDYAGAVDHFLKCRACGEAIRHDRQRKASPDADPDTLS